MDSEVPASKDNFDGSADQIITTDEISTKGLINQVNAEKLNFSEGIIMVAQAGSLDLQEGLIGLGNVQNAKMTNSSSFLVFSERADLVETNSTFMVARSVSADKVKTGLLVAGRVDAPVETTLDGPRALIAGLAFGLGLGLVLSITRLLFGQRTQ